MTQIEHERSRVLASVSGTDQAIEAVLIAETPQTARVNKKEIKAPDIDCRIDRLFDGAFKAVRDTRLPIRRGSLTAFMGLSGCGKSSALRCLNRMNDLVRGFRLEGHVHFMGRRDRHQGRGRASPNRSSRSGRATT